MSTAAEMSAIAPEGKPVPLISKGTALFDR